MTNCPLGLRSRRYGPVSIGVLASIAWVSIVEHATTAPLLQEESVGIRMIEVASYGEAQGLRARIQSGTPFSELARAYSLDASSGSGGYFGRVVVDDLRQEFRAVLGGLERGAISEVTDADGRYYVFEVLTEEEGRWAALTEAARAALARGNPEEAENRFREAIETAESLGENGRPVLIESLRDLSALLQIQGDVPAALRLYRRAMELDWSTAPADSGVEDVLDAFTDLAAVASFEDSEFESARTRYAEAVQTPSLREALYWAMAAILDAAALTEEAEMTLTRAVEAFPNSATSIRHLADHHVSSGQVRQAILEFERALEMESQPGVDPALGVVQKSYLDQRIGDAYGSLALYDEARQAYERALEADPGNPKARFELGLLHYVNNRFDEALEEYNRMLEANPDNVELLIRIAQAELGRSTVEEAVSAARRAIQINPDHASARYVLGTSLIRMGQTQEGRLELQRSGELERSNVQAEERAQERSTIINEASVALMNGAYERAIEIYREAIQAHPDVALFRLNLATAQQRLGRHEETLETLRNILSLGLSDNALLHKALARTYAVLDDVDASLQHELSYVQRLDAWLRSNLD